MKKKSKIYKKIEDFGSDFGLSAVEMNLIREKKKLIQQLKIARTKSGLTQAALAKKVNSKQPAVARMESGQVSEVSMDFLVKIALILGVSISIKSTKKAA